MYTKKIDDLNSLNKSITEDDAAAWTRLVTEAADARARDPKAMDRYVATMKEGK